MGLTPEQHQAVDAYLAKHAGADAPLVKALLTDGELSTGDPAAKSPKGARGLMQLMPIAVKDIGLDPDTFPYDNPAENLKGGIAYVKKLREDYGFTNPLQIAAAYNAGPSAVKAAIAKGGIQFLPAETQAYVKRMHAALGQRVNAPTESSVPAAAPQAAAPQMPVMTDAADPVDYAQVPTDSVYTPPAGAVPGQAGAPIPVGTPGAEPPSNLAVAAAAIPRAIAGAVDLPGTVATGVSRLTGSSNPIEFPKLSNVVEPYLPQPQGRTQEYIDAASQGATIGAVGGPGGAVLGAASGVGAKLGGAIAEPVAAAADRMGLPKIIGTTIRVGGTLAGGMTPVAVKSAVKGGVALARAARDEARNAKQAVQELDDATAALEQAQRIKQQTVRTGRQVVRDAKRAAKQQTRDTESQLVQAEAQVQQAERNITDAIDDYLVRERNPVERAETLQRATQDNRDAMHLFVSKEYDDFLQRADDSGNLVPTHEVVAEAQQIIDDLVISGIPHEVAAAQARTIVQTLGRPGISFTHAQGLRSSLGAYGFKAKRAGQAAAAERFNRMKQEVDSAIVRGLPDEMKPEFAALRRYRRAEGRLFQNQFVEKLIADTPEGREVATAYAVRLLEGNWTNEKLIGLREVRRALGNNDAAGVLQDAFLRQAMADARGDLGQLSRILRSQDGLGQAARELLDPRAFQQLTELSDEMLRAQRTFQFAGTQLRDVKRTLRDRLDDVRDARATANENATAAVQDATFRNRAAGRAARGLGPQTMSPNNSVLGVIATFLYQRSASWRILLEPQKRATLLRALRTSASSAKGQEMLRTLAISGAVGQPTPSPATLPRPDAAVPAR